MIAHPFTSARARRLRDPRAVRSRTPGCRSLRLAWALVAWLASAASPAAAQRAPRQRGISLGLFSEDPGFSYRPLLDEIRATGADHVELVVAWYLADVHATWVHDHPRYTAPAFAVEAAIRDAHAAGLRVFLFPIVRLEHQASPDEWRGTLAPRDRAALLASYTARLVELAGLAARQGVELLSVGSELSTLDGDRPAWAEVVAAVRAVYPGPLTYSGNWDHYRQVAIYDLLDYAGLCGYFRLSQGGDASDEELALSWARLRGELAALSARLGRPILFTEVGYLSQRGASAWPWNEGAREPVDLADQERCYAAFASVWSDAPPSLLAGVYFWNWYGWGGPQSRGYTPRGKPAERIIRRFFEGGDAWSSSASLRRSHSSGRRSSGSPAPRSSHLNWPTRE